MKEPDSGLDCRSQETGPKPNLPLPVGCVPLVVKPVKSVNRLVVLPRWREGRARGRPWDRRGGEVVPDAVHALLLFVQIILTNAPTFDRRFAADPNKPEVNAPSFAQPLILK